MPRVLRLTVLTGPHRNGRFCLRGQTHCVIGRSPECLIQLAGTERDQFISRRHCQLVLDDTSLTVHDLGSKSGTYLGAEKIDTAVLPLTACGACTGCPTETDDFDQGCLLNVGGTTLRLHLVDCPPADTPDSDRAELWRPGETAKRDCPIECT
jgi:hypothetical protein